MHDEVDKYQREAVLNLFIEVMAILRDNNPFNPNDSVFGKTVSIETDPGYPGGIYTFKNIELPYSSVTFSTAADPRDYTADRMKVPVVPAAFEILFTGSLIEVSRSMLEKRLDLADYWIDRETGERKPNDMGAGYPPNVRIHRYRYRANDHANTRVPVNVQLDYADPDASAPLEAPQLLHVSIRRAYEILTPEQRKQKREEKEQRVRELYNSPSKGAAQ